MNIIITILTTMNILSIVLIGIIVFLGAALVLVLDDNQTLSEELQSNNKEQLTELIETFQEKYSDQEITKHPDSKGVPYKYVAHTSNNVVELILEKDRIVLKAWKSNGDTLCIVSNPIPRDILNNCPLKW